MKHFLICLCFSLLSVVANAQGRGLPDFTELAEKHVKLETDFHKTAIDIDNAVCRIKRIEAKIAGEIYG